MKTLEYHIDRLVPFRSDNLSTIIPDIKISRILSYWSFQIMALEFLQSDFSYLCHLSANVPLSHRTTYWLTSPWADFRVKRIVLSRSSPYASLVWSPTMFHFCFYFCYKLCWQFRTCQYIRANPNSIRTFLIVPLQVWQPQAAANSPNTVPNCMVISIRCFGSSLRTSSRTCERLLLRDWFA